MNVFEIVTDRVVKDLEKGTIPWHKPWFGKSDGTRSHVTGHPYSLVNQLLAEKPGEYLTQKQCATEGGKVKKGEKGGMIVFYKQLPQTKVNEAGNEESYTVPYLVYYTVFHTDQCEGIAPRFEAGQLPAFVPDEEAGRVAASYCCRTGCKVKHVKQDAACYSPHTDVVTIPLRDQFPTTAGYYSALFHAIGHSTGHSERLDRPVMDAGMDEKNGREELVAELTAAAVLNTLGFETKAAITNTSAYIKSWVRALKDDKRMIVWAAARAEKALELIMGKQPAESAENAKSREVGQPLPEPGVVNEAVRKAAASFAAACFKQFKETKPQLAGAFVANGRQYIMDRYIAVGYDQPMEGLPSVTGQENPFDVETIMRNARIGEVISLPPLDDLYREFKKAKDRRRDCMHYTELSGVYINSAYLIRAMVLTGVTGGEARMTEKVKPLYITGDGCEAVVFPALLNDAAKAGVWRPNLAA